MVGRVIQGFFAAGSMHVPPDVLRARSNRPGPAPVQCRQLPGAPQPAFAGAHAVTAAHATVSKAENGRFEIDPVQIGLARGGGSPLPEVLLAKMEAAFSADFSAVRVHVGPQASRIGALAFTTGNDLYFAPGQYQPGSVKGQQLIGHELAHVIQQREGRVRAPGSGVTLVQDRTLEAEADWLGMRAAALLLKPLHAQLAESTKAPMHPIATPRPEDAVIQPMRYIKTRPAEAKGSVHRFKINGVRYLEDSQQRRWYWHSAGHWVRAGAGKAPLYNRFRAIPSGRGAPRVASFRSRMGSGASYSDEQRRGVVYSTAITAVVAASRGRRTYRANMRAATLAEGHITTDSATTYAAHFGAPVIAGGYNWCHLIGHGGGGSDAAANIVAASTHANSEQLEIERIVYRYRKRGVALRSRAVLRAPSRYLAQTIIVEVFFNGTKIYAREIDGFRADKPSFVELGGVEVQVSTAIYKVAGRG